MDKMRRIAALPFTVASAEERFIGVSRFLREAYATRSSVLLSRQPRSFFFDDPQFAEAGKLCPGESFARSNT